MTPARLPQRFFAHLIDLFFIFLIWIVGSIGIFFILALFYSEEQIEALSFDIQSGQIPLFAFAVVFVMILNFSIIFHTYFVSMEFKTGQTIGKRWMKIKVVSFDGTPISKRQAIYRDLVKVYLELMLTIPFLYIFMNKNRLRLGDKWAKTIVIENP